MNPTGRPRLLLVGGAGGFIGRQLLPLLAPDFELRSVHRHAVAEEARFGAEWIPLDVGAVDDWRSIVRGVDVVVNLAWYRWASPGVFERLYAGLSRLLRAAVAEQVGRFLQVSVPPAPERLELELPYLRWKRRFDRDLAASGVPWAIVRPTLLFGPGDVLLSVMIRMIRRYPFFPMFGDGGYRVNPLAVGDLARFLRAQATAHGSGVYDLGGPETFRYRELTDLMFRVVGKRPRYWTMTPRNGIRLAGLLQAMGSRLLYAYEVEWLASGRLVQPVWDGAGVPLRRVEPYLRRLAPDSARGPATA
ncbi:MAG: NAD(P)H-binding protein [Thermoplasmata archaeon]|nr:NAD(P)H-binding protein [Thermoplasmata archaeon]